MLLALVGSTMHQMTRAQMMMADGMETTGFRLSRNGPSRSRTMRHLSRCSRSRSRYTASTTQETRSSAKTVWVRHPPPRPHHVSRCSLSRSRTGNKKQCKDTVGTTCPHHLVWRTKFGEHMTPSGKQQKQVSVKAERPPTSRNNEIAPRLG